MFGFSSPDILWDSSFNPLGIREAVDLSLDGDLISATDYRIDTLGRVTGIAQEFDTDVDAAGWWWGDESPCDRAVSVDGHPDGRREEMIRLDRKDYSGQDPCTEVDADWRGLTKYTYTMSDSNKLSELTHTPSDDFDERIARYAYTYTSDAKIGTYNSTFFDLTTTIELLREQSFDYDGRNQLLQVTTTDNSASPLVRTYEYDQDGNRITKGPPVDQDPLCILRQVSLTTDGHRWARIIETPGPLFSPGAMLASH